MLRAFVTISLSSGVPDPVLSLVWLAVRQTPGLRDILKWTRVGVEKPTETELKEDRLVNA